MEFTYSHIEPLIHNTYVDGNVMHVDFRTPGGQVVQSSARIQKSNSIQGQVQRRMTDALTRKAKRSASRLVRQALGGGFLGRTGSQIVRSVATPENVGVSTFSAEEKRNAILEAFNKVADYFDFDSHTQSFKEPLVITTMPNDQLSGFEQQVKSAPVENPYDREVLARMLVELANADGHISREEKDFLGELIGKEFGSLPDLLEREPLSQIECEEVSDGPKETIYMMAAVMSMVDFDLDDREYDILMEYAEMFGFDREKKENLLRAAQFHTLEGSISSTTPRAQLYEMADKLRLAHDEAERCLIQMKKRG